MVLLSNDLAVRQVIDGLDDVRSSVLLGVNHRPFLPTFGIRFIQAFNNVFNGPTIRVTGENTGLSVTLESVLHQTLVFNRGLLLRISVGRQAANWLGQQRLAECGFRELLESRDLFLTLLRLLVDRVQHLLHLGCQRGVEVLEAFAFVFPQRRHVAKETIEEAFLHDAVVIPAGTKPFTEPRLVVRVAPIGKLLVLGEFFDTDAVLIERRVLGPLPVALQTGGVAFTPFLLHPRPHLLDALGHASQTLLDLTRPGHAHLLDQTLERGALGVHFRCLGTAAAQGLEDFLQIRLGLAGSLGRGLLNVGDGGVSRAFRSRRSIGFGRGGFSHGRILISRGACFFHSRRNTRSSSSCIRSSFRRWRRLKGCGFIGRWDHQVPSAGVPRWGLQSAAICHEAPGLVNHGDRHGPPGGESRGHRVHLGGQRGVSGAGLRVVRRLDGGVYLRGWSWSHICRASRRDRFKCSRSRDSAVRRGVGRSDPGGFTICRAWLNCCSVVIGCSFI